ncbi:MAG TPA: hypothetical protein VKA94_03350 [Hyphomicrobiales bacterium]|nr:hypothetical protein [Hyphomicrobiales bacterium]
MLIATLIVVSMFAILGSAIVWTIREVSRVNDAMTILQARIERAYGFDLVADNETGVYSISSRPFGLLK